MTLRSLLAVQTAFLLAGTSAPGRPAAMGVIVDAYRAHLGRSTVSPGGAGAAAAGMIVYEKHRHKDAESPDHP